MNAPDFLRAESAESLLDLPEYALLAAAAVLLVLAAYAGLGGDAAGLLPLAAHLAGGAAGPS